MRSLLLLSLLAVPAAASAQDVSPAAARRVVERYYAAIDRGDFRTAYLQWDDNGRASGKSYAAFRQGFAATARTRVTTATPTDGDAGMSQRWITIPVDVHAVLKNGRRQHFVGSYTLHRVVAGVGAPARDQNWHIGSAKLSLAR